MSQLYVNEPSAQVGVRDGRIEIKYSDGMNKSLPIESIDGISLFGPVSISTHCIRECIERGIDVQYYSTTGKYFGRLGSTSHVNVARQRMQARLGDNESFRLALAKRIIRAKIHNQTVVLRRYTRSSDTIVDQEITAMKNYEAKIEGCQKIDELMGYEGIAARSYYDALSTLVVPEFRFTGRSRQPPLDAFNSMLSLGYTILMYAVYGALENRGLNPYFGFLHSDADKHPTLASDMMEEWRAVIVDSVVMSMVNGHEIKSENFYSVPDEPGIYLDKTGFNAFIGKLERRFAVDQKYLHDAEYAVSFRRAINLQALSLAQAIEAEDAGLYTPIIVR